MLVSELPQFLYGKLRIVLKSIIDLFLRICSSFFRTHCFDKNSVKSILLINLQGIGDVVMTTPFLTVLRSSFPKARIDYLTSGKNGEVLLGDARVDNVHSYKGFFKQLLRIRRKKSDLCVNLFRAQHSGFLSLFSGATYITGLLYSLHNYRNFYLDQKEVYTPSKTRNQRKQCVELASGLGFTVPEFDSLSLKPSKNISKRLFTTFKLKGRFVIGLHPGANWPTRCWVLKRWVSLVCSLHKKYHKKRPLFLFIGAPHEFSYVEQILKELPQEISYINCIGKAPLSELPSFLSLFNLLISTNTGPMHVAIGVKCKTVGLFGVTRPWFLVTENEFMKVVYRPGNHLHLSGWCFDFNNQPLLSCHRTMKNITVEDVMKKVKEVL